MRKLFLIPVLSVLTLSASAFGIQVIPQGDLGGMMGQGMAQGFNQGLAQAMQQKKVNEQMKQQNDLRNNQHLVEAAEYLINRKNTTGKLTEDDLKHAALKYSIATSTKFDDSLYVMKLMAKKV